MTGTDDWPLVTNIWDVYDGSIMPPRNVKLSDAWLYIVLHSVPPQVRGYRWPFDFTTNGGIRATRKPVEPTVVLIDANELYYPVWVNSRPMQGGRHRGYVLCGTTLFNHWIVTQDAYHIDLGMSAITYGTHPVPDYALRKSHIAWARDVRSPNRTGDMFYTKRSPPLPSPYPNPQDVEQSHFTVGVTDLYRVHVGATRPVPPPEPHEVAVAHRRRIIVEILSHHFRTGGLLAPIPQSLVPMTLDLRQLVSDSQILPGTRTPEPHFLAQDLQLTPAAVPIHTAVPVSVSVSGFTAVNHPAPLLVSKSLDDASPAVHPTQLPLSESADSSRAAITQPCQPLVSDTDSTVPVPPALPDLVVNPTNHPQLCEAAGASHNKRSYDEHSDTSDTDTDHGNTILFLNLSRQLRRYRRESRRQHREILQAIRDLQGRIA
jgi:hypothetical protein